MLNNKSSLDGYNMSVHIEMKFDFYKTLCMSRVALTVCDVTAPLTIITQLSGTLDDLKKVLW